MEEGDLVHRLYRSKTQNRFYCACGMTIEKSADQEEANRKFEQHVATWTI